jgi:uncharacterized protein (DUF885 family)
MTVARSLRTFLLAAALLPASAYAAPATPDAATRLHRLFADTDEGLLKRNPLQALYRGDLRYADQIGDLYSDAHYAGEKAADEDALKQLSAIPRASLDPTDRIAYDTFKRNTEIDLESYRPDLLKVAEVMPINHFYGLHLDYADLSSGQGAAPFKTVKDYEDALKRHAQYPHLVDEIIRSGAPARCLHDGHPRRHPARQREAAGFPQDRISAARARYGGSGGAARRQGLL